MLYKTQVDQQIFGIASLRMTKVVGTTLLWRMDVSLLPFNGKGNSKWC
jgi:hypothetical protein